jgi:hypothetical protein
MNSKKGGHITHVFVTGEWEERKKGLLGEILASTPQQAFDSACPQGRQIRETARRETPASGHEALTEMKSLGGLEPIVRGHATRASTGTDR